MDKWCLQGGNAGEKLLYCVIINAHLISNINMQHPSIAATSTISLRMCLVIKTRTLSWGKSTELINIFNMFLLLQANNFVSVIPEIHWQGWAVKSFTSFKKPTLLCCGDGTRKNKAKRKQMQLEIAEREGESMHTEQHPNVSK